MRAARHSDLRWQSFNEFRPQVKRLYERSGWRPMWLWGPRPSEAAMELIARLGAADSLGLEAADYDAEWLSKEAKELSAPLVTPTPKRLARFDLALSIAAVRFTSAIHRGRVSPRAVRWEIFRPRASKSFEMAVDSLRDAKKQALILERLQPRFRRYQLLKNGLAHYRALSRDTSLIPLPPLPSAVQPGGELGAAPQLRRLLGATGDLDRTVRVDAAPDTRYTEDLVAAVKQFQTRHGFEATGVIDAATAARLNRPFENRVRQIELALERYRWLPTSFKAPPIIVNIPAFRVDAFRGMVDREDEMLSMDVVVGSAGEQETPVFSADMKYLIFRPYWEVPASIMAEELAPKAMEDPEYLRREGMILVNGERDDAPELPVTPENLENLGKGTRVRQLPGPDNALGLVKFLFPNKYNVYMHDTPAKGLFSKPRRDYSHGCIRLSDPAAMAAHVLRDQPEWTMERIRAAMHEGKDNRQVKLKRPIPVHIIYATAVARESGDVFFYSDIYGLDKKLDTLLRAGYPYPK